MKDIIIALPPELYVLRPMEKQDVDIDAEEYNIYFDNMILPYSEAYDVKIQCEYGRNFGAFWRINTFPYDKDSFPLKVMVYDEWGVKLAEKECTVIMTDKQEDPEPYHMMCIGDSMTRALMYVEHLGHKLKNLVFHGLRSRDGYIRAEGRGGWSYPVYFGNHQQSPFVFPKGIDAKQYFGDLDFENMKDNTDGKVYAYKWFPKYTLEDGMVYHKDGKLWKFERGEHQVIDEAPEWEFSFTKYMQRHTPGAVDCVSLLMGANDLFPATYENSDEYIRQFLENTEKFVASVREYDPAITIILNLPIAGADQVAWGVCAGSNGTTKQYRYNMIRTAQAMIDRWGNDADNIYLSAMSLNLDRKAGFAKSAYKMNFYSDLLYEAHNNHLHPNRVGYMQMGDALAAVIEYVRKH